MKITKKIAALLCALGLFTPPLAACHSKDAQTSLPSSSEGESIEEDSSESDFSQSDESSDSAEDDSSEESVSSSSSSSSSSASAVEKPVEEKMQYIRCTGESVNIRSGAGTEFSVLGNAEKDTMYAVIGKVGSWYKTYYRGQTAYIYASYASVFSLKKSDDPKTEKVLAEGYKLIGVPYVYGAVRLHDGKGNLLKGFSVQAFDCSSLVQYVFYKGANKTLQVTTRTQVTQGKYVARSELRRGDCIYFTNEQRQYKTGIERIGHVAVYLGNDYILHTSSDYARIEKMTQKRWNFYVEARRFL